MKKKIACLSPIILRSDSVTSVHENLVTHYRFDNRQGIWKKWKKKIHKKKIIIALAWL